MIGYFLEEKPVFAIRISEKNGDKAQCEQRTEKHKKNRCMADKR